MEFSHLNVMQNWHEKLDDFQSWQGEIELAILADELGFDALACVEHHFEAYGMCGDNLQYLSYLAGRTKNAKLMPGAIILPWNDPVRIAEKIAVAQSMGSLSLSLRSIADNSAELERAVAAGDVKLPAGTNPVDERRILLSLANRPSDSNTTFTTGGDVSRFQRRSVPGGGDDTVKAAAGALNNFSAAISSRRSGEAPAYSGPVVRVSRGNSVSIVPVGAR